MLFHLDCGTATEADKSAMGAINRPLPCHPEPFAAAQGKLREGSVALGSEMLRCAQHDRAVTPTNAWIKVFMYIIGPDGWPIGVKASAIPLV
jgi:hypothetical protein